MVRKIDGIEFNEIENFVCRHCGATEVGYEHLTSNDAIKAYCNCCGAYIKFVKQLNAVPRPATEKQIKFAKLLARINNAEEPDYTDIAKTNKFIDYWVSNGKKKK